MKNKSPNICALGNSQGDGNSQDRYPNQYQNRQVQGRYQGDNQRSSPNRYNNEGNGWNQGSRCGRKNLDVVATTAKLSKQPAQTE